MSEWRGKVAVITGGSAGLGWALAQQFARAGSRVVLAARNTDRLNRAVGQLTGAGHDALGISTDVTDDSDVRALIDGAVRRFGRIDVLVNGAGRSTRGHVLETTPEDFRELLELNFLATVRCTLAASPHLIESGGNLVNVGSLAGKAAVRFMGAYPASKAPLVVYSQQLRFELSRQGVHVLLVCPGPLRRADAGQRYDSQASELPAAARQPGGGVKLSGLSPEKAAAQILKACERRVPELVLPGSARWLFAIAQLSPSLGDWIVRRMSG